jgi:propanol-preferring alcohol dehydrogenase
VVDVRRPAPGPGEVLVRVEACALCGTDRHALESGAPVTPGHETAGEVVETGPGVDAPRPGTRGVVYLVDFCGTCAACRRGWTNVCLDRRRMYGFDAPGGFADYQVVRAGCFVPVDPRVRPGQATALLDLLGTAGHALRRAGPGTPRRVLVLGCGPIGLGVLAMAAALGTAERYGVDLAGHRLELAERLGAVPVDATRTDPVAVLRAAVPDGFDVVVEAAGRTETQRQALELAGPGGRVLVVAHNPRPLELRTSIDLIQREVALIGSEYFPVAELAANQALLLDGRVDPGPLLTHRFPLEELEAAYDAFWSGRTGKVLVEPAAASS